MVVTIVCPYPKDRPVSATSIVFSVSLSTNVTAFNSSHWTVTGDAAITSFTGAGMNYTLVVGISGTGTGNFSISVLPGTIQGRSFSINEVVCLSRMSGPRVGVN